MHTWAEVNPAPHSVSHNAWVLMGFAVKLANSVSSIFRFDRHRLNSIGVDWPPYVSMRPLIRDTWLTCRADVKSSKWALDEEASQRRSIIFWQVFVQDTWLLRLTSSIPRTDCVTSVT